ncbi:MAG: hypothetical protein U0Q55_17390 [Vicinamibacterales bacterium]
MQATIRTAVIVATVLSQAAIAAAQPPRTTSELADDALAARLWQIAVATGTRIGFQSIEPVSPTSGALWDVLVDAARDAATAPAPHRPVIDSSLDDAIDMAIAANPRYEWGRLGSFVVVRPAGSWNDAHDPLNRPVRRFHAERSTDIGMLSGIGNLIHRGQYIEHPIGAAVVSPFSVESGSIVDVLNALIETADLPFWQAGYRLQPPERRSSRVDLQLILAKSTGIQCASGSRSPEGAPSHTESN